MRRFELQYLATIVLLLNVASYAAWQGAFRKHQPKTLIIWGKKDPFSLKQEPQRFLRDLPNAKLVWLDSGHFVLDENHETVAKEIDATF